MGDRPRAGIAPSPRSARPRRLLVKTRRALALAEKQEAERPLSLSACESCARTREPLEPSGTHSRSRAAPRHREHRVAARPGGVPALAVSRLVSAVRFKSIRFGRSIVQTYSHCPWLSSTPPIVFTRHQSTPTLKISENSHQTPVNRHARLDAQHEGLAEKAEARGLTEEALDGDRRVHHDRAQHAPLLALGRIVTMRPLARNRVVPRRAYHRVTGWPPPSRRRLRTSPPQRSGPSGRTFEVQPWTAGLSADWSCTPRRPESASRGPRWASGVESRSSRSQSQSLRAVWGQTCAPWTSDSVLRRAARHLGCRDCLAGGK